MRLGLIADSYDNIHILKRVVELFNHEKVEYVVHAGDYVAPFAVKELLKVNAPFVGVFGNNDGEKGGIKNLCSAVYEAPHSIRLNNRIVTITHVIEYLDDSLGRSSDVIIYGHTHKAEIKEGRPLFINPGECGGWLTGISSVAILDIDKMEGMIIEIP